MTTPLLEQLSDIAERLELPYAVGLYAETPAPDTYLVFTPLVDSLEVFADNQPGIEVEEVRIALFTKTNYLGLRNQLTRALIDAGLTVTARRYIGYEADTGFHHYSIDASSFRACP
ncbi:hypothetical protein HMPREF9306_00389 [Propionimicrobium lymphophilum ACS-093-V-SCH5]|uniref:DUF3168 domain-containing protein n=1 Tax=Propionimicrobium lymphophilum ACS-093-V-SCH5 TaxID=883161 RepID=S2X0T3_9ACTN|nr:hypothetical protein [Propionimicrobium lymphophilum]EPD33634.1 hypothetical protein HMPREF9306_00389 [Propionimicrobium lymphophilum ACS-093-V-SCH5]